MPAAAVIPAPVAYIKVVEVETFVVETGPLSAGPAFGRCTGADRGFAVVLSLVVVYSARGGTR